MINWLKNTYKSELQILIQSNTGHSKKKQNKMAYLNPKTVFKDHSKICHLELNLRYVVQSVDKLISPMDNS